MANTPDIFLSTGFAQFLLQDCVMIPKSLLENYRLLPMGEAELLLFLRISGPLLRSGQITLEEAAAELKSSPAETELLLQPLLACGVLEEERDSASYHCRGLFRFLHECWLNAQRSTIPSEENEKARTPMHREMTKDYVLAMSRLYRRFEAELGRSLKYSENEQIRQWLEEDGFPAEMIEEALRRAVLQNKGTLAYINSILRDWSKKGFRSLEQVLELDVKPGKNKSPKSPNGKQEDDDFIAQLAQIEANAFKL